MMIKAAGNQEQRQEQQSWRCGLPCPFFRRWYHELSYRETNATNPISALHYFKTNSNSSSIPSLASAQEATATETTRPVRYSSTPMSWILVEMHAASWNPADYNSLQGKYPTPQHDWQHLRYSQHREHPHQPFIVGGSEGLGKVIDIVKSASYGQGYNKPNTTSTGSLSDPSLSVGDWVVLGLPGMGSYRSHMWVPRPSLLKLNHVVPDCITVSDDSNKKFVWSTLLQLAGTAYRMLQMRPTSTDETHPDSRWALIQDSALSNVGYVVQKLLPLMESQSTPPISPTTCIINVIRSKDPKPPAATPTSNDSQHQVFYVTEDDLQNCRNSTQLWGLLLQGQEPTSTGLSSFPPKLVLALDAVGGSVGSQLVRVLDHGGACVNYGALSQQPLTIPAPLLLFQSKLVRGHWHSGWMQQASLPQKQALLDTLVRMVVAASSSVDKGEGQHPGTASSNTWEQDMNEKNRSNKGNSKDNRAAADPLALLPPVKVVPLRHAKDALLQLYREEDGKQDEHDLNEAEDDKHAKSNNNNTSKKQSFDTTRGPVSSDHPSNSSSGWDRNGLPLPTRPKLVFDLTKDD
ncbi:hypothetical protein ACA910_006943 [Epithemia clementina (nom. ined.)]